jgi:hypothetical protein
MVKRLAAGLLMLVLVDVVVAVPAAAFLRVGSEQGAAGPIASVGETDIEPVSHSFLTGPRRSIVARLFRAALVANGSSIRKDARALPSAHEKKQMDVPRQQSSREFTESAVSAPRPAAGTRRSLRRLQQPGGEDGQQQGRCSFGCDQEEESSCDSSCRSAHVICRGGSNANLPVCYSSTDNNATEPRHNSVSYLFGAGDTLWLNPIACTGQSIPCDLLVEGGTDDDEANDAVECIIPTTGAARRYMSRRVVGHALVDTDSNAIHVRLEENATATSSKLFIASVRTLVLRQAEFKENWSSTTSGMLGTQLQASWYRANSAGNNSRRIPPDPGGVVYRGPCQRVRIFPHNFH